jgi:hypothetical protein
VYHSLEIKFLSPTQEILCLLITQRFTMFVIIGTLYRIKRNHCTERQTIQDPSLEVMMMNEKLGPGRKEYISENIRF